MAVQYRVDDDKRRDVGDSVKLMFQGPQSDPVLTITNDDRGWARKMNDVHGEAFVLVPADATTLTVVAASGRVGCKQGDNIKFCEKRPRFKLKTFSRTIQRPIQTQIQIQPLNCRHRAVTCMTLEKPE